MTQLANSSSKLLHIKSNKDEANHEVSVKLILDEDALVLGELKISPGETGFVRFNFEIDWARNENNGALPIESA